MAKAAESEELRQAFEQHLRETEGQIARLDQVFESLGRNKVRMEMRQRPGTSVPGSLKQKRREVSRFAP